MNKDKCYNCGTTTATKYFDYEDDTVLCEDCHKKIGNRWQKEINEQQPNSKFPQQLIMGVIIIFFIFVYFLINYKSSIDISSKSYIIRVDGTSGTEFTGSIGGGGSSRTIEGTVPETYTISGWPAVAVIQKKEESGIISVTIEADGKTLDSQSTSASYGVVTVSSK